jgi:hypothetical protein
MTKLEDLRSRGTRGVAYSPQWLLEYPKLDPE